MSDPRLTPANARVMALELPQDGSGRRRVTAERQEIVVPLADLLRAPDGSRDRQVLLGDEADVLETRRGWCFVRMCKDGYVGYLPARALRPVSDPPTHRVGVPASHVYTAPDLKSPDREALSFGARLHVLAMQAEFCVTPRGFVPQMHLRPLTQPFEDPVAIAEMFLGTAYLWGGNSRWGIDCSGLVQIACLACGQACPADSDLQAADLGERLPPDADLDRGDLIFWRGHVAWVASRTRIVHATAHSMSVICEDMDTAVKRIHAKGGGPITMRKRLPGLRR